MSGDTRQRTVTVVNPVGFHLRPISAFARRASQFEGTVWVSKGDQRVNGKSTLELMLLVAEAGTPLLIEVCGPGAEAVLNDLAEIVAAPSWGDEEGNA
jgi:phosphocarrier protein HPr